MEWYYNLTADEQEGYQRRHPEPQYWEFFYAKYSPDAAEVDAAITRLMAAAETEPRYYEK